MVFKEVTNGFPASNNHRRPCMGIELVQREDVR